jgi:hypothetical protein
MINKVYLFCNSKMGIPSIALTTPFSIALSYFTRLNNAKRFPKNIKIIFLLFQTIFVVVLQYIGTVGAQSVTLFFKVFMFRSIYFRTQTL